MTRFWTFLSPKESEHVGKTEKIMGDDDEALWDDSNYYFDDEGNIIYMWVSQSENKKIICLENCICFCRRKEIRTFLRNLVSVMIISKDLQKPTHIMVESLSMLLIMTSKMDGWLLLLNINPILIMLNIMALIIMVGNNLKTSLEFKLRQSCSKTIIA